MTSAFFGEHDRKKNVENYMTLPFDFLLDLLQCKKSKHSGKFWYVFAYFAIIGDQVEAVSLHENARHTINYIT